MTAEKIFHSLISATTLLPSLLPALTFFQLSQYRTCKHYFKVFRGKYLLYALFFGGLALANFHLKQSELTASAVNLLESMFALTCVPKSKLRLTPRTIRLIAATLAINTAISLLLPCFVANLMLPLLIPLANWLMHPIEQCINGYYLAKARATIARLPAKAIAVTGSYGKTSVKNILQAMLNTQYACLATPSSYNTPLGIASFINNTRKKAHDKLLTAQYIVYELGARHSGDIARLCKLVKPHYGVITAIENCHIQTFGSIAAVAEEKTSLLRYLPSDGACVAAQDNFAYSPSLLAHCPVITTGKSGLIAAQNTICDANGSSFDLTKDGKLYAHCVTQLIGLHNVDNIVTAAALAIHLGITGENIAKAVATLTATPHRQSVIVKGGVVIIDDSYNANASGVKALSNTLALYDGVKIVVAQGIVEQGKLSYDSNFDAGVTLARNVNHAYIIGSNGIALKNGLIKGGLSAQQITFCADVAEAVKQINALYGKEKRVIAFQNDLPENMN